jgi:hypothetical protein
MASPPLTKTGLLIIRAWVEEDVPGFRARVIQLIDVTGNEEGVAIVGTAEELTDAVETWLQELLGGA